MNTANVAQIAKNSFNQFSNCSEEQRVKAIEAIAQNLRDKTSAIIAANQIDLNKGSEQGLSEAMLDRLMLTESRIEALAKSCETIAKQPQVVGKIIDSFEREDGLEIMREQVPLGVIGMIFESRPNVVVDCSCLAIKSGNCIILKGGKEANESNAILTEIVQASIEKYIPKTVVQLISTHAEVSELLNQVGFVDVIIPRGGEGLIKYVYDHSKVPVIAHFKGLCHIFVDETAKQDHVIPVLLNAKVQRPGVCNAMETLLLHENLSESFVDKILFALQEQGVELRVCSKTKSSLKNLQAATPEDWETEYLDKILSVKMVKDIESAIEHIQKYGSHHTEAILSQSDQNIARFKASVDASSIMINASTRFNDGGEYGLGAELGISTTKLHAYGPMGANEMTTKRFVVKGKGHIKS